MSYVEQERTWPASGRHILACHDDETVIVYQAYRPSVGHHAIEYGGFGGDFSYSRMSWVKPNFLWMMYRSDWGRSMGQEIVLGVRLRRSFFDSLLERAVPSTFDPRSCSDEAVWRAAVRDSDVRLQWDPDHLPDGSPCARRALQLGLRGDALEHYGKREIVEILDVTGFVQEQRRWLERGLENLLVPVKCIYQPPIDIASRIGLDGTC